ncbi:MAG TPA: DUF6768 family protein [Lacunisphaera sp.]|nr:DUF6768 family protein [Lacunisphaera sp.]
MNDIDQKIQAALRGQPGGDALASEPNLAEEVITAFRGRHRGITALAIVLGLGFFALAVWAGIRFYESTSVREQLLWGAVTLWAVLFIAFMKVWFWLEMHSNRILREVKRIELLLISRPPGK